MRRVLLDELQPDLFGSAQPMPKALRWQFELLKECSEKSLDLGDELKKLKKTYDHLRYRTDPSPRLDGTGYVALDKFTHKPNHVPIVSFFSGAGGLDLGFEAAGFEHLALVEHNKIFCETLRHNRPDWQVIGPPTASGDVSNLEEISADLRNLIGNAKRGFNGIFVGGPPCQPFSIAANQRFSRSGEDFKRIGFAHKRNGNLLFEYIALIRAFRPKAFLIENVPGLFDVDGGVQLKRAVRQLEKAGYRVENPFVLNAAEYSVPQHRFRLFIVGTRGRGNFLPLTKGEKLVSSGHSFAIPQSGVANNETRAHKALSVFRYMQLLYGQRDQLGRVDRLDPMLPSKTVIAGGTAGGGRSHLHPHIPRTISVRECARLQTFPDNYVFTGTSGRQFTQVGNAVPPVLGAQLALALNRHYFS